MMKSERRRAALFGEALKILRSRHEGGINPENNTERSDPNQQGAYCHETEIVGNVNVRGIIKTELDPAETKKRDTSENKRDARDKARLFVEIVTFISLIFYAFIAYLQWQAMSNALETANEANTLSRQSNSLLEESTRARFQNPDVEIVGDIAVNTPVKFSITSKNIGHALAILGSEARISYWSELPPGDNPIKVVDYSQLSEPGDEFHNYPSIFVGLTKEFISGIPTWEDFATSGGETNKTTIYIYGRVDYQTLGHVHDISYCYYVLKSSPVTNKFLPVRHADPFLLHTCLRWNYSH